MAKSSFERQYYKMTHSMLRRHLNAGCQVLTQQAPQGAPWQIKMYIAAQQSIAATGRQSALVHNHALTFANGYNR